MCAADSHNAGPAPQWETVSAVAGRAALWSEEAQICWLWSYQEAALSLSTDNAQALTQTEIHLPAEHRKWRKCDEMSEEKQRVWTSNSKNWSWCERMATRVVYNNFLKWTENVSTQTGLEEIDVKLQCFSFDILENSISHSQWDSRTENITRKTPEKHHPWRAELSDHLTLLVHRCSLHPSTHSIILSGRLLVCSTSEVKEANTPWSPHSQLYILRLT